MSFLNETGLSRFMDKAKLAFAAKVHNHDDRYFTESEVDGKLSGKANTIHYHGASDITSGELSSDRLPVVPASKGGTGVTSLYDAAHAINNSIPQWNGALLDDEYIAVQYNNEWGREKLTNLWKYIKGKSDSTYLSKAGGTMTGPIVYSTASGSTKTSNYISAGGGCSMGSGLSGLKIVTISQSDARMGFGTDLTGSSYEHSIVGTKYGSNGIITFGFFTSGDWTSISRVASIDQHGTFTATTFKGALSGNASSATTLTGLTSTVAELNYVDGVTSNIQTQLNSKASSSHTHNSIKDSGGGGYDLGIQWSGSITSTSWPCAFNDNGIVRAISPANLRKSIGAAASSHTHTPSQAGITTGTAAPPSSGTAGTIYIQY